MLTVDSYFDQELARLRGLHPGWRIWFVPRVGAATVWCAQREPTLNCGSPDELDEAIRETGRDDHRRPG